MFVEMDQWCCQLIVKRRTQLAIFDVGRNHMPTDALTYETLLIFRKQSLPYGQFEADYQSLGVTVESIICDNQKGSGEEGPHRLIVDSGPDILRVDIQTEKDGGDIGSPGYRHEGERPSLEKFRIKIRSDRSHLLQCEYGSKVMDVVADQRQIEIGRASCRERVCHNV